MIPVIEKLRNDGAILDNRTFGLTTLLFGFIIYYLLPSIYVFKVTVALFYNVSHNM